MQNIALIAKRPYTVDGVERAEGDVFELPAVRAAIVLYASRGALKFAPVQPKAQSPKPKARRRKKVVEEPVEANA